MTLSSPLPPWIAAVLLAAVPTARAQDAVAAERDERLAPEAVFGRAYLEHLCAGRIDEAGALLADDVVYQDPTAVALTGAGRRVDGKTALLRHFGRAGGSRTTLTVERAFVSGDLVVLGVTYHALVDPGLVGAGEAAPASGAIPAVTLLRLADGLVAEHVDHVGYDLLDWRSERARATGLANLEAGQRALRALASGGEDARRLEGLFADDVVYHERTAPDGPRLLRGRAALAAAFASVGGLRVERALPAGRLCVLEVVRDVAGTSTAAVVLLELEEGRVRRLEELIDRDAAAPR